MVARPWSRNSGCPISLHAKCKKETDEELTAIMTKGENKMPRYEKTLKKSQMEEFVACMGELGDREQGRGGTHKGVPLLIRRAPGKEKLCPE